MNTHVNGRYSLFERNYRIFRELNSGSIDCAQYSAPQCLRSSSAAPLHLRRGGFTPESSRAVTRPARRLRANERHHPCYEASVWYGFGAPKNTSIEIIDKLNQEINTAPSDPKIKADLGDTVLTGSPADFGELIVEDIEKWAKVIRAANIKPD
jgi:hypothetical protein